MKLLQTVYFITAFDFHIIIIIIKNTFYAFLVRAFLCTSAYIYVPSVLTLIIYYIGGENSLYKEFI